jgi:hypothetical protein
MQRAHGRDANKHVDATSGVVQGQRVGEAMRLVLTGVKIMQTQTQTADVVALQAQVAALTARLAEANKPKALSLKVSEKGAVSLYGMGRFPVTLYREQWERVFACKAQIEAFIATNAGLLSVKAPKV